MYIKYKNKFGSEVAVFMRRDDGPAFVWECPYRGGSLDVTKEDIAQYEYTVKQEAAAAASRAAAAFGPAPAPAPDSAPTAAAAAAASGPAPAPAGRRRDAFRRWLKKVLLAAIE